MKALSIGCATYDIASMFDEYPIENKKYDVVEKMESGGGQAANAACVLGKWGVESYLSCAIGSDSNAEKIKKEFEMNIVRQDFVETNFDKDTSLAFILINKKNGSKTIMNMTSADKTPHIKKTELEIEPDIILIDGYEYQASTRALNRFPSVTSVMSAEKLSSEVVELSKYCKYVICSKDFAENLTKIEANFTDPGSLLKLYNAVKYRYPRNEIIIVLEENGVIYSLDNQIKVMPSLKIEIKDTTASADIFHGAFAYGILANLGLEKTIAYALIASSMSATSYGGRISIPSLNNVIAYYNQKFGATKSALQ